MISSRCLPELRIDRMNVSDFASICDSEPLDEDFREADDGVHRRAQLVAHVGEEAALGLVGLLRLAVLHLQLAQDARFGDGGDGVLAHAGQLAQVAAAERVGIAEVVEDQEAFDAAAQRYFHRQHGFRRRQVGGLLAPCQFPEVALVDQVDAFLEHLGVFGVPAARLLRCHVDGTQDLQVVAGSGDDFCAVMFVVEADEQRFLGTAAADALVTSFELTRELRSSSLRPARRNSSVTRQAPVSPWPARSMTAAITEATWSGSARSSAAVTLSTTWGSPASAALRTRSIRAASRDRGTRKAAPDRLVRRCRSLSAGGLVFKAITEMFGRSWGRLVHYRRFECP